MIEITNIDGYPITKSIVTILGVEEEVLAQELSSAYIHALKDAMKGKKDYSIREKYSYKISLVDKTLTITTENSSISLTNVDIHINGSIYGLLEEDDTPIEKPIKISENKELDTISTKIEKFAEKVLGMRDKEPDYDDTSYYC